MIPDRPALALLEQLGPRFGDEAAAASFVSARERDEAQLLLGLRRREPWACAALMERHGAEVAARIRRVLGPHLAVDFADVLQDVFVQVLASLDRLRDPAALSAWLATVATRTARRYLRNRRAQGWLRFGAPGDLPELGVEDPAPEVNEAHRRIRALLGRMPPEDRAVLVLRHVERLGLREVAARCQVSLATAKRRLKRAQERFAQEAAGDRVLGAWLEEGGRRRR